MSEQKPRCPDCGSENYSVWKQGPEIHCECLECNFHLVYHSEGFKQVFKTMEFPDLPADFVERIRRKGRQIMSLQEIAEEWKKYQKGI